MISKVMNTMTKDADKLEQVRSAVKGAKPGKLAKV